MKGGLAVVRTALAALADAGLLAGLPLALVSVADEETGSADSRPWLEDLARGAAAALVFEGGRTTDQLVTRRKGTGKVRVHVTGKAAHAGNDLAAGVNAIWALARFIDRAQAENDAADRRHRQRRPGPGRDQRQHGAGRGRVRARLPLRPELRTVWR